MSRSVKHGTDLAVKTVQVIMLIVIIELHDRFPSDRFS